MKFLDAISTCLTKYSVFSGRGTRSEYWWFFLFTLIAIFLASNIDRIIFGMRYVYPTRDTLAIVTSLALLIPSLAAGWRRMHDTGHSGWWSVGPLIVVYAGVVFFMMVGVLTTAFERAGGNREVVRQIGDYFVPSTLVPIFAAYAIAAVLKYWWLARPSQTGPNKYGPDPHEVTQ